MARRRLTNSAKKSLKPSAANKYTEVLNASKYNKPVAALTLSLQILLNFRDRVGSVASTDGKIKTAAQRDESDNHQDY